ncbi:MAG: TolC family protein [Deltaproteobacteria bacterium]|nr:TolC family protein [Deltaproteobacteria bacterium]
MISVAAVVAALALAGSPITLAEVRVRSRDSVQALQAELDRVRAGENLAGARSAILPQVNLGGVVAGRGEGPKYQFNPFTGQVTPLDLTVGYSNFDLNVTVQQMVYDGGRWWSRIAQAGAQEEAAAGQLREQRNSSEFEGVRRFYELLRAQERARVLGANEERSRDQVARAEALFQSGRAGRVEVLSAQVNAGQDRISALQHAARVTSAQADLAVWLALGADVELRAEGAPPEEGPADALELWVARAREQRPLLQVLAAQVRSAEQAVGVARADYLPAVSAVLALGRTAPLPGPFFLEPSRQNYLNGGLNFRWNLFAGHATDAAVRSAEAGVRAAQLQLEQAQREVEADVRRALSAWTAQREAAEVARQNLACASEALEVARGRFSVGEGATLDVRDAQLKLAQAELQLLETRIDAAIARVNLERTCGREGGSP